MTGRASLAAGMSIEQDKHDLIAREGGFFVLMVSDNNLQQSSGAVACKRAQGIPVPQCVLQL